MHSLTDKDAACGHSRILFSHEKEENYALWDHTDGFEGIVLSEISQTEKNKYCLSVIWEI